MPDEKRVYIDKQFNKMRAEIFVAIELALQGTTETAGKLKEAVRGITSHTWTNINNFLEDEEKK